MLVEGDVAVSITLPYEIWYGSILPWRIHRARDAVKVAHMAVGILGETAPSTLSHMIRCGNDQMP